ncbi:MAG: NnrS family protein, partial [Hyphomicrobiales bacterium]
AGVLLCAGGVALAVRMARWRGWQTVSEPLVVILHIGYLWLAVSLGLLGLSALIPEVIDGASAVHGLTTGAIGTMTLAVMTRATLGHTGAELTADRATVAIYVLVTSGALLRVLAALSADGYVMLMTLSGLLWSGAFAVFLLSYGPRLLGSEAGGAVRAKAG